MHVLLCVRNEETTKLTTNGKRRRKMLCHMDYIKVWWRELIGNNCFSKKAVIWITSLSGSGKSTLTCVLSQGLHMRGKLSYILDGDNIRHCINSDFSFNAEDRAENIRRTDAGIICIACLISPYRKDRDACRVLLPEGDFIEVFLDVPLQVCESRDPKGLYKLVRAGKIKCFTGIDHPYEPPLNSTEIVLQHEENDCPSPSVMVETVITYLEEKGYLHA